MIILNLELFIQQTKKMGTYEYNYNGKKPTEDDLWVFNEFADEVNLYFISNPAKKQNLVTIYGLLLKKSLD